MRTDRNGTEKWIYVEKLIAYTLLKINNSKLPFLKCFKSEMFQMDLIVTPLWNIYNPRVYRALKLFSSLKIL